MDADLGFRVTPQKRVGFGRREPQIVAHVEVSCQVHYEKAHEKILRSASLHPDEKETSLEVYEHDGFLVKEKTPGQQGFLISMVVILNGFLYVLSDLSRVTPWNTTRCARRAAA